MALLVADGATISIASELIEMEESTKDRRLKRLDNERVRSPCCYQLNLKMSNCLTQKLCFCCCKPTRLQHKVKQRQELMENELEVANLLKRLRIVEGVVKENLS